MTDAILNDLEHDLETSQKHQDTPIFHRIKFASTSIYLTKTHFHHLLTARNKFGHYRIFSWDDFRARAFLGFDVGTVSPALGAAQLLGRFTPDGDNLLDVQYQSRTGKHYFADAKSALAGLPASRGALAKIDPGSFLRMKEVIPTGAQGRAIYGEGNLIIDGPAGTGKTTTILHRIKVQLNQGISASKILLLARSQHAAKSYTRLLKDINVKGVVALPIHEVIRSEFGLERAPSLHAFRKIAERGRELWGLLLEFTRSPAATSTDVFASILAIAPMLRRPCASFIKARDTLHQVEREHAQLRAARQKSDRAELKELEARLTAKAPRKKDGSIDPEHSLDINAKVNDRSRRLKASRERYIETLKANEQGARDQLRKKEHDLKVVFCSDSTIGKLARNDAEKSILPKFLRKLAEKPRYVSVIIDEAQNASIPQIELANLLGTYIVLSGDEFQREAKDGVGEWGNLEELNEPFTTPKAITRFNLARNFRQTFELGSCSHNYRELALGRPLTRLDDEYYENEKGFFKPRIVSIDTTEEMLSIIRDRMHHIRTHYIDAFPLTIFYENNASLSRMRNATSRSGYSSSIGPAGDFRVDIVFISLLDIAGREFPVIIAPLSARYSPQLTYVILSRAQFDLTIIVRKATPIDEGLETLRKAGFMES